MDTQTPLPAQEQKRISETRIAEERVVRAACAIGAVWGYEADWSLVFARADRVVPSKTMQALFLDAARAALAAADSVA